MGKTNKDFIFFLEIPILFVVVMDAYEIVKDLGSGNFGVAKLVRDKRTKELFAVKFIERGQKVFFLESFYFSIWLVIYFLLCVLSPLFLWVAD